MEYATIAFIAALLAGAICILFISDIKAQKRLRASLIDSYGKFPTEKEEVTDRVSSYHHYMTTWIHSAWQVDDITWNDLDMDKVFQRINSCITSVGEEYLYHCLHELQFERKHLLKREETISFLMEHAEDRLTVQMCLAKLGKVADNGLSALMFHSQVKKLRSPFLFQVFAVMPLLCSALLFFSIPIGAFCIVLSFAVNLLIHFIVKFKIDVDIPAIGYFASMLYSCRGLSRMQTMAFLPAMVTLKQCYEGFESLEGRLPGVRRQSGTDFDIIFDYISILFYRIYGNIIKSFRESSSSMTSFMRCIVPLEK